MLLKIWRLKKIKRKGKTEKWREGQRQFLHADLPFSDTGKSEESVDLLYRHKLDDYGQ